MADLSGSHSCCCVPDITDDRLDAAPLLLLLPLPRLLTAYSTDRCIMERPSNNPGKQHECVRVCVSVCSSTACVLACFARLVWRGGVESTRAGP